MHPILANRERLFLYLAAWLPIAALLTAILVRDNALSLGEASAIAGPMCLFYAFMCLAAWYICRSVSLHSRPMRLVVTLAASSMFSSLVWVFLGRTWASALEIVPSFSGVASRYVDRAGVLFLAGVLLFLLSIAVHFVLFMVEESRAVEKRALEFQVLAREAELRALRAQIDPHFLFNSLNSISALTVVEPAAARRMCILLAEFMRTAIVIGGKERITLAEELKLTEGFLEIEKVRFGSRLIVDYRIAPGCVECLVPPLMIQPLVENAVTHGIAPLVEGGSIVIHANRRETLEVVVENPYDADGESKRGTGLGIRNVRERLANAFRDDANVTVTRSDGSFRIQLQLPFMVNGVLR